MEDKYLFEEKMPLTDKGKEDTFSMKIGNSPFGLMKNWHVSGK